MQFNAVELIKAKIADLALIKWRFDASEEQTIK